MTPIGDVSLAALEAVASERLATGLNLLDAADQPGLSELDRWRIQWEAMAELRVWKEYSDLASFHRLRRIRGREAAG